MLFVLFVLKKKKEHTGRFIRVDMEGNGNDFAFFNRSAIVLAVREGTFIFVRMETRREGDDTKFSLRNPFHAEIESVI